MIYNQIYTDCYLIFFIYFTYLINRCQMPSGVPSALSLRTMWTNLHLLQCLKYLWTKKNNECYIYWKKENVSKSNVLTYLWKFLCVSAQLTRKRTFYFSPQFFIAHVRHVENWNLRESTLKNIYYITFHTFRNIFIGSFRYVLVCKQRSTIYEEILL